MAGKRERLVRVDGKGRVYLGNSFKGADMVLVVQDDNTVILKRAKVSVTVVGASDKKGGK